MPRSEAIAARHSIPYRNILIVVLLINVVVWWGEGSLRDVSFKANPIDHTPGDTAMAGKPSEVSFASLDGQFTFSVPSPGDPEYDDYLEMLAYPRVRSSLQNSPGFAMPYDPEWRSMITGRREVPEHDYELTGGSRSLEQLGDALLAGIQQADASMLFEQRINEDEFGTVLWPEFPQSRPYLKIPLWEAWGFNHAKGISGIEAALQAYGHRKLQLEEIGFQEVREFRNFKMLEDVRIVARDLDSGEVVELKILPAVVECKGRFKALNFSG